MIKVPDDKVKSLIEKLQAALHAGSLSLSEVQSLIGSLNFVCKAVAPGRAFLRRLIGLTIGVTKGRQKSK